MRPMFRWGLLLTLMLLIIGATMASPSYQETDTGDELLTRISDLRNNTELLADNVFGNGERPDDWSGNDDPQSESAVEDLFDDNELLADEVFDGERPIGWISFRTDDDDLASRHVRSNVELLADEVFNAIRPTGWVGGPLVPESAFQQTLGDLRNDLELLANRVFPAAQRPDGWLGNTDFTSASMLADLFIDNELLADAIFSGTRPAEWIGVSSSVGDIIARNIRHDLELSANEWVGEEIRPDGWIGGPLLFQCDQTLMNAVYLLSITYGVNVSTSEDVFDYCGEVSFEVSDELIPAALGSQQLEDLPEQLLAVRGDLERLADEILGVNNRPGGWIDNVDVESSAFNADLQADLNLLRDVALDTIPPGWIQTLAIDPVAALRSYRYNLELLADLTLGTGVRPNGWQETGQFLRCDPDVQNLVTVVSAVYPFSVPVTDATGPAFCDIIAFAANRAAENPPPPEVIEELEADEVVEQFTAESRNAFAYDDAGATVYYGVLPWGTPFRAWYRNFGDSTMMYVSGDGFALFIDRRWTTMTDEAFRTLPTLEGVIPMTFCDANWCNGPAPTPTPTGSGPILDIINSGTEPVQSQPQVTPDADTTGKQLVTWNNIRVTYRLFQEEFGTVLVSLELCTESNQVVCEPVNSVFNTVTQQGVSAQSVQGGLNVYQLPYGYRTEFVFESQTLYSNDIWLNDPSLGNTGQ